MALLPGARRVLDRGPTYLPAGYGDYNRAGSAIDDYERAIDAAEKRQRRRAKDYKDEWEDLKSKVEQSSAEDKAYWVRKRDEAESNWKAAVQDLKDRFESDKYQEEFKQAKVLRSRALEDWESIYGEQRNAFEFIRDQQIGLAEEIRKAPSSVAEQARLDADEALSRDAALSGALGGSLGYRPTVGLTGDTLSKTSALRAQEYADRIGQRSTILTSALAPSRDLAQLGISNVNVLGKIGDTGVAEARALRGDEAKFYGDIAASDFAHSIELGRVNTAIGTELSNRDLRVFDRLGPVMEYARTGDQSILSKRAGIPGMWGNLGRSRDASQIARERLSMQQEAQDAQLAEEEDTGFSWSKILGGLGAIGGGIVGGIFGGPAGAVAGGAAGGSLFGGIGGWIDPDETFAQGLTGGIGSGGQAGRVIGGGFSNKPATGSTYQPSSIEYGAGNRGFSSTFGRY